MLCFNCGKIELTQKQINNKGKFCSHSCCASFNNKGRIRSDDSKNKLRIKVIEKLYGSIIKWETLKKSKAKQKAKKINFEKCKIKFLNCKSCNKFFCITNKSKKQHCSNVCMQKTMSLKACKRIIENGSNNWTCHNGLFEYKSFKLNVDSKLEKAGIIYLCDIFEAERIEKFKNILNFKYEDKNYNYNPDFFVIKNDKVFIVEIKMRWTSNSKHEYYKMMQPKKECLSNFCLLHKYEMIWLDFDYDKKFYKIYRQLK